MPTIPHHPTPDDDEARALAVAASDALDDARRVGGELRELIARLGELVRDQGALIDRLARGPQ